MTNVVVATKKLVKIDAIKEAFNRYFDDVEITAFDVNSGVPEQPTNELVFKGAENRLNELKKICEKYDYIVSCEGGLISQYGYWLNVQVIMVEDKNGKRGIGLSQGYQIPDKYVEETINTSVAKVFDKVFNGDGGIRMLTRNQFTRANLIEDGTIMALTRLLNGDIW